MNKTEQQTPLQRAALIMVLLNGFTTPLMLSAANVAVSAIYLGLTCGPVIGGYLIDVAGWRASFVFHIPLAIVVLFIAVLKVPGEWLAEEKGEFDIKGAMIYSLSIVFLCIGASTVPASTSLILILFGLIGIFLFFNIARRIPHPIFDVTLFYTNRVFTLSCLASFILYTATFANVVLISLYLQYLKEMSAFTAGLFMMIQPLTMAVFSPMAGRLSDHIEPRIIASAGMIITAIGLVMLALLNGVSSTVYLMAALIITGLGFSLFSSPNTNAIMSAVEKRFYGSAAGSIATMRVLGQMSSMVLVTLVFALIIGQVEIQPANYHSLQQAIHICFTIAALLCLPGLLFSLVRGSVHKQGI